jgi:CDP-diacylglycerol--serine O-phosphatidyltransferase
MQENREDLMEEMAPVRRKGIYILPNLFTTGSLFVGFYAIVAGMNHDFYAAAVAIILAMLFDGFDGRVARLINAQSAFGAQYDSLSDIVCFGVTPALVAYNWSLVTLKDYGLGKVGWLSAFIYMACVALRLARFNSRVDDATSKRYFYGLPCPAAAGFVGCMVWVGQIYGINNTAGLAVSIVTAVIMVLLGLLMVSNVLFRSFKDIDLKSTVRFAVIVIIVLVLSLISIHPAQILFLMAALYVLSGPTFAAWRYLNRKKSSDKANSA